MFTCLMQCWNTQCTGRYLMVSTKQVNLTFGVSFAMLRKKFYRFNWSRRVLERNKIMFLQRVKLFVYQKTSSQKVLSQFLHHVVAVSSFPSVLHTSHKIPAEIESSFFSIKEATNLLIGKCSLHFSGAC